MGSSKSKYCTCKQNLKHVWKCESTYHVCTRNNTCRRVIGDMENRHKKDCKRLRKDLPCFCRQRPEKCFAYTHSCVCDLAYKIRCKSRAGHKCVCKLGIKCLAEKHNVKCTCIYNSKCGLMTNTHVCICKLFITSCRSVLHNCSCCVNGSRCNSNKHECACNSNTKWCLLPKRGNHDFLCDCIHSQGKKCHTNVKFHDCICNIVDTFCKMCQKSTKISIVNIEPAKFVESEPPSYVE
jgi:hypothetical protein